MRRNLIRPTFRKVCMHCGIEFGTSKATSKYCTMTCAARHRAMVEPEKRAEQLRRAREALAYKLANPPDVVLPPVPVLIPARVVDGIGELPAIPVIDHASRIMLGWAGARL